MSLLIKGGRVVTAADDYVGDLFVEDERITLIGKSLDIQADRTIERPANTCSRASSTRTRTTHHSKCDYTSSRARR